MTNTAAPPGGKFLALDKCHDDGGDAAGKMRGWAENSGGADAGSDGLLMRRPERQRRRPTEVLCASPVQQGGEALRVLFRAFALTAEAEPRADAAIARGRRRNRGRRRRDPRRDVAGDVVGRTASLVHDCGRDVIQRGTRESARDMDRDETEGHMDQDSDITHPPDRSGVRGPRLRLPSCRAGILCVDALAACWGGGIAFARRTYAPSGHGEDARSAGEIRTSR